MAAGVELRQLRYFVTLAEELNFGRAAEREHIVQSSPSRQVQRLERGLGVRLLERSIHHVSGQGQSERPQRHKGDPPVEGTSPWPQYRFRRAGHFRTVPVRCRI